MVPGFLGSGLGVMVYRTHVINASEIPPLMSLPCLKGNRAWIDCDGDRLFLPHPLYEGWYVVLHLKFTGAHFVLPIDKVEESYESDKVEEQLVQIELIPYGKKGSGKSSVVEVLRGSVENLSLIHI